MQKLAFSFQDICDLITSCTNLPRNEAEARVWKEAVEPGWNVSQDVVRFGVIPYHLDKNMLRLYSEGDGFIFESLVSWAREQRQNWIKQATERIRLYSTRSKLMPDQISILMLGDGVGSDSIYLAEQGFTIHYFDVPGSQTFNFAIKRFECLDLLGNRIEPMETYQSCLDQHYDVVLCFEVLEHLEKPKQSIHEISQMVKPGGIALITDDFGDLAPHLSMHLASNARFMGQTPFLFLKNAMPLTWYSRDPIFKPYEFIKRDRGSVGDWLRLWSDSRVRGSYLSQPFNTVVRMIRNIQYWGS